MNHFVGLLLGAVAISVASAQTDKVFCYFGSWAMWRPGNGRFNVNDIDPNKCTHISYAFFGLGSNGEVKVLGELDQLKNFANLKSQNSKVKLLISMGGWNEGSTEYTQVLNNPTKRANLVNNVYKFVVDNRFDGFDFDWEYPAQRGGVQADKVAFVTFLRELKKKFSGTGLITSVAVGATRNHIQNSYDVKGISDNIDIINIMSYDLQGSYTTGTSQNAPLYASSIESTKENNVDASLKAWLNGGADPKKILLGVALYGRSFQLASASGNRLGSPTVGAAPAGPYSQEAGMLTYLEICETLKSSGWTTVYDEEQQVPYSFKTNTWVGYDNVQSVKAKAQYAIANKLGGIMVWSIESEDAKNICGGGRYPLLTAINSVLNNPQNGPTSTTPTNAPTKSSPPAEPTRATETTIKPTTETTTTETSTPTPSSPPSTSDPFECTTSGTFRDASDCNIWYQCLDNGFGGLITYQRNCPSGLWFDVQYFYCNYPEQVTGC